MMAREIGDRINFLPLLHITISRGKFLQAHEYFTRIKGGNYFEFVSDQTGRAINGSPEKPKVRAVVDPENRNEPRQLDLKGTAGLFDYSPQLRPSQLPPPPT